MTRRRFVQGAVLAFATVATGGGWALSQGISGKEWSSALPAAFQWGWPLTNGLQLGAQIDIRGGHETSLINCMIRNQGKVDAQYDDYFFGSWEKTEVWARPVGSTSWVKLERDPTAPRAFLSVGPGSRYHTLKPGEKLLWRSKMTARGHKQYFNIDYMPYADYKAMPASTKNVNFMPYSFAVSLDDFFWPAAWKGKVELQVVHTLLANGKLTTKKNEQFHLTYQPVRSGSVTISANMVRVLQMPRNRQMMHGYIPLVKTTKAKVKGKG